MIQLFPNIPGRWQEWQRSGSKLRRRFRDGRALPSGDGRRRLLRLVERAPAAPALPRLSEKAIAVHHTATDDAAWDGPAMETNLSNDDGAAEYQEAYAWQDPEADADTKAAYRYIHHEVDSEGKVGAANTTACSTGIGVLNGGRGGTSIPEADRQGVYDHLAAHLKDAGQEEIPELQSSESASRVRLGAELEALREAGRVLSGQNEQALKDAVTLIEGVLDQVDAEPAAGSGDDDAGVEEGGKRRKLAEAWDSSAWDASDAAWLLSGVISLMGDESDEPDDLATLTIAFNALLDFIRSEASEIGSDDEDDSDAELVVVYDYEALRAKVREGGKLQLREARPVPVREAAIDATGRGRVKVIQPGWGSSGYYPADVLERDGAKAFSAGTHMFWDHPTLSDEVERPERSLRDLAGTLTTDAAWDPAGPQGPGLYAETMAYAPYREAINEMAPDIGCSIVAYAAAHWGEAEGQEGPIIDALLFGESVDYVTVPGAGGQVLQLFESARQRRIPHPAREVRDPMKPETVSETAKLRQDLIRRDARDYLREALADIELPAAARKRVLEVVLAQGLPVTDDQLDEAKLQEQLDATVKTEASYLAEATGAGRIRGMGASDGEEKPLIDEEEHKGFFMRMGMSEAGAKIAAAGRR